jgi:serine/threonine protein kinase
MDEYLTCPICHQPHRQGARFCPTTGRPLTQPLGTPTTYTPTPGPSPVGPGHQAAGSGALTGQLPSNAILNNRYIIIKKIGQGGMAAVYQATDSHLTGVIWAVKEMSDAALPSPEERSYAVQTFQREAQLLRTLNHPNLPRVTDFFSQGGKQYLVMEFVPGQTMDRMLSAHGGPYTEAETIHWGIQLCDVLAYLHSQNPPIIFRDLKPGNIMLTPQGQIKLIDFGIVRFFKPGQTKDTQALGTPGFFAPEATSGQTDARSDVYSLCVTLHQLLTYCDPANRMFALPPARSLNPSVSARMESILQRGLQMHRDMRWANMTELRTQLAQLAATPAARSGAGAMVQSAGGIFAGSPFGSDTSLAEPGSSIPVPARRSAGSPLTPMTSRPTTRLIMAAARLSPWQLALMFGLPVIALVVLTAVLAPVLDDLPIKWSQIPIIAIFGALGYAAYPRWMTGLAGHTLLTLALVGTIYTTTGSGYPFSNLLIAILVSGLFIELWTLFLRLIKRKRSGESWGLELGWLAVMGPLVIVIFYLTVSMGNYPLSWLTIALAPLMSGLGWFLGDLINQYITFRQTGLKRRP